MGLISKVKNKISRDLLKSKQLKKAQELGIRFSEPNFVYFPKFNENSVVIDVGCSYEADLSVYMIEKYQSKCYGVDPTLKHAPSLKELEEKFEGKFTHLPYAVTAEDQTITFYESLENESGSIMKDHVNVVNDNTKSYEVKGSTVSSLINELGIENVDLLKIDLEGAEYDLLAGINPNDLSKVDQLFVEFHHHAIERYSIQDTEKLVDRIIKMGFKSFTIDNHNYLFYR